MEGYFLLIVWSPKHSGFVPVLDWRDLTMMRFASQDMAQSYGAKHFPGQPSMTFNVVGVMQRLGIP